MKKTMFLLLLLTALCTFNSKSQTIDTLLDVGGYRLHFRIIKGTGMPILFEAGGGNDGSIWNSLLKPVAELTRATLITYDRAGFGTSEFDSTKHGLLAGVEALETGLRKLGYNQDIMLVAHSFGGFYAGLYAARHPETVKTAVLIDVNLPCFFTEQRLDAMKMGDEQLLKKMKLTRPGAYYMFADRKSDLELLRKNPFPLNIALIDLVAEQSAQQDSIAALEWRLCHQQFAAASSQRQGITAYACGHYIFMDNPGLVLHAIVQQYAKQNTEQRKNQILEKAFTYSLESVNQDKRRYAKNQHSEGSVNSWAYATMRSGRLNEALEIFKLNVLLHPNSANCYDSLAEGYEQAKSVDLALQNYRRALQLDPKNEHASQRLKILEKH